MNLHKSRTTEKIQVILAKGKETKGTYVYEEELDEGGKPPVHKTQYIQKWALGSNPPARIKVTIEAAYAYAHIVARLSGPRRRFIARSDYPPNCAP